MITGVVRACEARIRLAIRGRRKREQILDAVIDTGYTGCLTLPRAQIAALGLCWQTTRRGILADGSERLFHVFEATVRWDRKARQVLVDETESDPLVGMALLSGYELKMQVRPRGKVTIKRLP